MELFSKHINATTLLSYYKKFGVSYTRVVYSHPIRYSPEDYKLKRKYFVKELVNHMLANKVIIYFDETSSFKWDW